MSFWRGKNVFLTGASGIVGSRVLKRLINQDSQITIFTSNPDFGVDISDATKVKVACGTLQDIESIKQAINGQDFDAVLHFAGQSQVGHSEIADTFAVNTVGTLHLMRTLSEINSKASIMLASTAACCNADNIFLNSYAASKYCAEIIERNFAKATGLNSFSLRLGNIYGPGERHNSRLVMSLLTQILKDQKITLRSSLKTQSNLLFVEDAVDAILSLTEYNSTEGNLPENLVLCNTESVSIQRVIDELSTLLALSTEVIDEGVDLPTIKQAVLSPSKFITENLAWQAKRSLNEGLRATIEWYQKEQSRKGKKNESLS
ncbi:NAD-dependent epimerase/dehydratase family protein [Glaciecola petra]|uniref:NAD(P)-dependent oxidoreductase n=1 Tax=Glaciecola petra TaxID=3075602 RepID=A0ABU2ZMA7_9ALTE|nr:NAD(P)-dependent oxidoreductase [Aestuariibacter sp. P117]MDT0593757.1 NAD(P)-dependent oxidoreductase [Aestuariibacter sp. P117]